MNHQSRIAHLGRLARTMRHLSASQVMHRVRLRAQRSVYSLHRPTTDRIFSTMAPSAPGWPAFQPLDFVLEATGHPSPEENLRGTFEFLNQRHDLGEPIDWNFPHVSQLWRYHLHYFDWAWDLATHHDSGWAKDAYRQLYQSWAGANPVGKWDAWSPYVVSIRAWTMCSLHGSLVAGEDWERTHLMDLAGHARYLRANVEFDVGGNHLVKNLKALVGLGIFLGDDILLRFGLEHLRRQTTIQVLPDGGHFERSPSYHAQVLSDIIDVAELARAAGVRSAFVAPLEGAIDSMRTWLAWMLLPNGTVPLFNDCLPVGQERLQELGVPLRQLPMGPKFLANTGYAVAVGEHSPWHVVMDVGPPCPPELPAHAHADALSLIASVGEEPILVDSGTSTYAGDLNRRQYERSTAAHNTVVIDDENSTEVYGAFRAGRRHRVTIEDVAEDAISVSHDGYRHLSGSPVHRRRIELLSSELFVEDTVHDAAGHDLIAYFHLAPGLRPGLAGSNVVEGGRVRFEFQSEGALDVEIVEPGVPPLGLVGRGQGILEPSACLLVCFGGDATATLRTRVQLQLS